MWARLTGEPIPSRSCSAQPSRSADEWPWSSGGASAQRCSTATSDSSSCRSLQRRQMVNGVTPARSRRGERSARGDPTAAQAHQLLWRARSVRVLGRHAPGEPARPVHRGRPGRRRFRRGVTGLAGDRYRPGPAAGPECDPGRVLRARLCGDEPPGPGADVLENPERSGSAAAPCRAGPEGVSPGQSPVRERPARPARGREPALPPVRRAAPRRAAAEGPTTRPARHGTTGTGPGARPHTRAAVRRDRRASEWQRRYGRVRIPKDSPKFRSSRRPGRYVGCPL